MPTQYPLSDQQITEMVCSGDGAMVADALRYAAKHHLPRVERELLRRHPRLFRNYVDDALAFALHQLSRPGAYDPSRGELSSWLFVVASRAGIDEHRRWAAQPRAIDPSRLAESPVPENGAMDFSTGPPRGWDKIAPIYLSLSEKDRLILEEYARRGGQGQWTDELAKMLGMSPGAIRVRLHRLLERIRRLIGDWP